MSLQNRLYITINFSGRNKQRRVAKIVRRRGDHHPPRRFVRIGSRSRTLLLRQMDPEEVLQGGRHRGRSTDGSALRDRSPNSPAQNAMPPVPQEGQRGRLRGSGRDERAQGQL